MAQITLNSSGVASNGALVLQSNGTTTAVTISTAQVATLEKDAVVNGLTVGRGAGAVATNTAVGASALAANQAGGTNNTAIGNAALDANTTGDANTAVGDNALGANTTASNNTAVGYQAGYSNQTGLRNTFIGATAGYTCTTPDGDTHIGYGAGFNQTTGLGNTFVGGRAGGLGANLAAGFNVTTGTYNTFIGGSAGSNITTGSKNSILGNYNGNQGGLDIRTASNYIVLSDGDGNVRIYNEGNYTNFGNGAINQGGSIRLQDTAASGFGPVILGRTGAIPTPTDQWVMGSNSAVKGGTTYSTFTVMAGGSGGVNLSSGGTSWGSASDSRLKNVTGTYTNALADIAQIEAVKFTWKDDEAAKPQVGVIAQSVQTVVPEAVEAIRTSKDDETDYLSVRYTELIPLMIASIKELKAEFDAYKEAHP